MAKERQIDEGLDRVTEIIERLVEEVRQTLEESREILGGGEGMVVEFSD